MEIKYVLQSEYVIAWVFSLFYWLPNTVCHINKGGKDEQGIASRDIHNVANVTSRKLSSITDS